MKKPVFSSKLVTQMDRKKFFSYLALGLLLILFYVLIGNINLSVISIWSFFKSAFSTFFIGIGLAFILNIPTSFFEKILKGTKIRFLAAYSRVFSILIALLLFFLILAAILGFIIPSVIDAISTLSQSILLLSERLQGELIATEPGLEAALSSLLNWLDMSLDELYARVVDFARENSPRFITSTFNTILGTISSFVTFFISTVFAIYFVTSKEMLARHARNALALLQRPKISDYCEHLAKISFKAFRHFVVAQVLEAIIIGSLCTLGMFLLGFSNASVTGVFVGVTALIPVYGAFVGAIFGAIIIAVQSPVEALFFVLFIIILQQLEGNLIYPKVVGGSLGLPAVYTFTIVTICGAIFGLTGMLLAVPAGSVCYTLLKERKQRLDMKKQENWSHEREIKL